MITWQDIKKSLHMVADNRLNDPATIMIDNELTPFDVWELEIPEIGDKRLVAIPQTEIEEAKDGR